jgi:hypothetical protein
LVTGARRETRARNAPWCLSPLFFLCRLRTAFLFDARYFGALSVDALFGAALIRPALKRVSAWVVSALGAHDRSHDILPAFADEVCARFPEVATLTSVRCEQTIKMIRSAEFGGVFHGEPSTGDGADRAAAARIHRARPIFYERFEPAAEERDRCARRCRAARASLPAVADLGFGQVNKLVDLILGATAGMNSRDRRSLERRSAPLFRCRNKRKIGGIWRR